ncbi:MAG: beta-lactamase family protein, partial [Leptospiraceae bacterium]|nr:beta-lactamase family protein [Leptospiraceae bacterium]
MRFVILGFLLFSFEIYAEDKKQAYLIDQLQVLERQIAREIETSRAKGVTKGTYASIYSNSEKVFEMSEGIQSDSLFPIASISKTFTAFSILKLIEGGYLKFHDPVSKYIAEFREISSQEDQILIQDLLHHTSGLPSTNGTIAIT